MAERWYATGRRKAASARVWLTPGTGRCTVNGREPDEYFRRKSIEMLLLHPFEVTQTVDQFDVHATVAGGGLSGQAGAIKHGISRALTSINPDLRGSLKKNGLLTRDPRAKERKKYGQPGARKRFQFSKR